MRSAFVFLALCTTSCQRFDDRCRQPVEHGGWLLYPDGSEEPVPVNTALSFAWSTEREFCTDWPHSVNPVTVSVTDVVSGEVLHEPDKFRPDDNGMRRVHLPFLLPNREYVVTFDGLERSFRTGTERAEMPPVAVRRPNGRYLLSKQLTGWWGHFDLDPPRNSTIGFFYEVREVNTGLLHLLVAPDSMDVPAGLRAPMFPARYDRPPGELCFEARYVNEAGEAGEPSEVVCPPRDVRR